MSKSINYIAVYAAIKNDLGETLFMQRAGSGYIDGYYSLPAGHVDEGEFPKDAMARELKEETGLEISSKDLEFDKMIFNSAFDTSPHPYVDIFFIVKNWRGEPKIMEPNKCTDLKFFGEKPAKIVPEVAAYLESDHKYIEI